MIHADLEAAGIPIEDDAGRVLDFHSLRHAFCTNLAKSGVLPQMAQRLMRHSTVEMTMKFYTHIGIDSMRESVNKLPAFPDVDLQERKTGTMNADEITLETQGDLQGRLQGQKRQKTAAFGTISGKINEPSENEGNNEKARKIQGFSGFASGAPERARTSDRGIRNPVLYPTELQAPVI